MEFKAIKVKKGSFKILGLEEYFDARIKELKRSLQGGKAAKPARKVSAAKISTPSSDIDALLNALNSHARKSALLRAGRAKDQLMRSLIPLYLARSLKLEVTSGLTSKFWAHHGVKFAAPNAAKALRQHRGNTRRTKAGPVITPQGIAYVDAALSA